MNLQFDGKTFRSTSSTSNGEVNEATLFRYWQNGDIVWAEYDGGGIRQGHLLGVIREDGTLDARYHHVNEAGELMTGICKTVPELLPSGKLRLHESWQWTCRDHSAGQSVVEEIGMEDD
ncbi:n-acetylglutamate synthase [Paenibacillus kobensis]|uniref:n-acetylglutamate synthase n=1 Tax=Paenibacillus kobensis TaxID=59841 RepID=UPI000FDBCD24|nr:n-acetylglutamate synthase [Paenibacillus kobensis]